MNAVQTAVITPSVALMGWGGKPWAYPASEKCLKLQREVPDWPAVPLIEALQHRHTEDTWFQALTAPDRRRWPRFRKALLLDKASLNSAALTYAVLDLDLSEHRKRPWMSRKAAEDALLEAIAQMNAHGWPHAWGYATRGGLRVGWMLDRPVPLVHAQSFMDQLHAAVPKNLPVPLDEEVVDWTRGYRLPWCPRADGKTFAWGDDAPPMALDALREGRSLAWRPDVLTDETIAPPRTVVWPEPRRDETPLDKRIRPCVEQWAQEIAESPSRHGVLLAKARALGGLCQMALDRGQYATPEPWAEILIAAASDSNDAEAAVWDAIEYGAAEPWWFKDRERPAVNSRARSGGGPALQVVPPMENGNTQPDAYDADEDAYNGGDLDGDADLPPDLDKRCLYLSYTDLGNARRMALHFRDDIRWCEARASWMSWTGTHWASDERCIVQGLAHQTVDRLKLEVAHWRQRAADEEDGTKRQKKLKAIADACAKHHHSSQGSGRIDAILKQTRGLPGLSVAMGDFDADPWLLNVQNGTFHLKTGEFRLHCREDLCSRVAPVRFDPAERAPAWQKFVREALPKEEVCRFMQRFIGYSLTGDASEQVWILFQGEGSNGKSTLLDVLAALLGAYATALPAGFLEYRKFEQHPTELTCLHRTRLATGTEPRADEKWDAEKIKRLTGGDRIKARFMGRDFFEFDPTQKLVVSCNDVPRTSDMGTGFWRRVVIVPFTQRWYREDEEGKPKLNSRLPAELRRELSGILNWALEGLKEYQDKGLGIPEACRSATQEYRQDQDHLARFLEDSCIFSSGFSVKMGTLYDAYIKWHREEGPEDRPLSKVQLGKRLSAPPYHTTSHQGHARAAMRSGMRMLTADEIAERESENEPYTTASTRSDFDDWEPDGAR